VCTRLSKRAGDAQAGATPPAAALQEADQLAVPIEPQLPAAPIGQLRRLTRFGNYSTTPPGGLMGKRETQIILKTDERKIVLELTGQIRRQINRMGREPGLPRGR
jgi:hypothetical protein